ncbi:uncharacterized protein LOC129605512 [Condylostylus longicornis]|uniref:uncharacterized protein LOC129605512 n=1 Tax=Condylostylus longicornis TaxID=2530218 RepID=UPI00244E05CF|nr:uncharacterized protein LOC129605512 [Condylostylus longicornis]
MEKLVPDPEYTRTTHLVIDGMAAEFQNPPQPISIPRNENVHKLFTVSDNQLHVVVNSSVKSGIYKKVPKQKEENEPISLYNCTKFMEKKLETLATEVLNLSPGKFKIYKNRNIVVGKDSKQRKRFIYKIVEPRSLNLYSPSNDGSKNIDNLKRNVGRPRNSSILKVEPEKQIIPVSITRSGRISKPTIKSHNGIVLTPSDIIKGSDQTFTVPEIKDKDFKYYKDVTSREFLSENLPIENSKDKRIRKIPSDSQCPVCNKILLGKRMQKHFETYPDHNIKNLEKAQSSVYELTLYKFLVNKIKLISNDDNDQKTDLFLTELSDLIEQIQSRNSKLVQSTSGIHFVSLKLSKILGIPEGQYSINMNAIESMPDPVIPIEETMQLRPLAPPQPRLADYNLSISLDDTITAKLNLSDNIIPSEESLLRTVNDLVQQDIKKIGDHDDISLNSDMLQLSQTNDKTSVMHYDHASDNAVEALNMKSTLQPPILDLSLDLFQFTS